MNGWLQRAMFNPPGWAVFLNPHFLPRRALYGAMQAAAGQLCGRMLDVGCGVKPYCSLLSQANEVVGLELDTPVNRSKKQADVFYDGHTFPFPDGSFQSVLCNQVLEHVFTPELFLAEIYRVLSSGGMVVLTVPFLWSEHEQPWDCLRYTSFGLRDRLISAGFEIVEQRKLVGGGAALCALAADRINTLARSWPLLLRLVVRVLLIGPVSVLGVVLARLAPRDPELYLDNFVVACKHIAQE